MTDLEPGYFNEPLSAVDPEIADAMQHELERQQNTLEMIASENFVPRAVLEAAGSVLTNKYAEGLPGKRYYAGCEWVDVSEQLAIDRAKAVFGAEHANVQPHAGAQANNAVYMALCDPGDTILGLELAHGGHLTHGMKLNVSGKLYHVVGYQVRKEDYRVDMEEVERLAKEHRPKVILAGWSAYSGTSTSPSSAASRMRWERSCSSTWRTSRASSRPASTRARFRTRMSSRPPRTRLWAGRAPA